MKLFIPMCRDISVIAGTFSNNIISFIPMCRDISSVL